LWTSISLFKDEFVGMLAHHIGSQRGEDSAFEGGNPRRMVTPTGQLETLIRIIIARHRVVPFGAILSRAKRRRGNIV
jgi:hypothetical protein